VNALLKAHDRDALAEVQSFRTSLPPADHADRARANEGDESDGQPETHGHRETGATRAAAAPEAGNPGVERLEAQVAALQEELKQAKAKGEAREAEAFERGKLQGRQEAAENGQAALEKLSAALERAQAEFAEGFDRFEGLALQIAQTALARILGDSSQFPEMVFEAVRHQLAGVDRTLVAGVRVSPCDFADGDAVAACASRFDRLEVTVDRDLAAGECVIDLRMGEIDVSIGKQWSRLSALLEQLATEGAPS
jgi:type III secretion protein L